ncbi:MAG: NAD-dependent epimerase/dehydratase family protein [Burkholderiaceae bacterium]|nr:NAD-dependent epimerase/dehydratase family protein [Burkholderiaceae bacterium]
MNELRGEPMLVTGGAGFLGRYVAAALAARGHPVTVLDNLLSTNSSFAAQQLDHPLIAHQRGSVFDRELVADLVSRHRSIVHLATVVGVEETISQTVATMENLAGTMNLVRCLTPDHAILFSSSADVYGAHSMLYDRPMRETDFFVFEHGLVNRWVYPHVKALEENLVSNSAARSVVIRVFNTYGPAMDYPDPKRVIPHFVANLLTGTPLLLSGDGSQTRSFCYVDDMVRGMIAAFDFVRSKSAPCAECFNIGNDDTVTIRSLAQKMAALGSELGLSAGELPIVPGGFTYSQSFNDTWNRVPDITHARQVLGFRPTVSLDEGLRRTLDHHLRSGTRAPARGDAGEGFRHG